MKPNHPIARRRARLVPAIEPLESRIAPTAVVSVVGGALQVNDAGLATHALTVGVNASNYRFTDPNGLTAGTGAIQVDGTTVDVLMPSVTGASDIQFGGGADTVTLTGTLSFPGGLTIDTGTGVDSVDLNGRLTVNGDLSVTSPGALSIDNLVSLPGGQSFAANTGDITFSGAGQIDAHGGNVTLHSSAGISSGTAANDILSGALTLSAGTADVGSNNNPLTFDASSLSAASGGGASLYLAEASAVNFSSLDAGTGTINLVSGKFVTTNSAGAVNSSSNLALSGTLDLHGSGVAVANFSGSATGMVTNTGLTAGSFSFGGGLGAASTFAGVIQDGGSPVQITKTGTGTEILTGANTYTGTTTIAAGKLQIGASGTTGSIGGTSVTILGTLTINHSDTVTLPNTLSGSGVFEQGGSGTTILNGANAMTGNILISTGTLQNGNGGGAGSLGTGSVTDNGVLAFNHIDNIAIPNDISGTGGLHLIGASVVTLLGNNTYTGAATIDTGATLQLASVSTALDSPLILNGGTVAYNLGGTHAVHATVTLGGNATVDVASGSRIDWTGNSVAGGNASFTKSGAGVLSHDATGFSAKNIAISGGALAATASSAFGTAPIDVSSGAAFWTEGATTIPNGFTLRGNGSGVSGPGVTPGGALVTNAAGGLTTFSGVINLAAPSEIDTASTDLLLSGQIIGPGTITKTGTHTLTLGNKTNTFGTLGSTSITVAGGVLQVATDKALGDAGNSLVFTTGGGLRTTAGFTSSRHVTVSNDSTFDVTGTLQLPGVVDGAGVITKVGTGQLVFGSGFTGSTAVSNATGPVAIGNAKFSLQGNGSAVITIVPDGLGGQKIETLAISATDSTTKIVVKGPTTPGAMLFVDHITSSDGTGEIGSITLRNGVVLGDGVADAVPELDLAGKVDKLNLDTISANALIRLGTGLTYNNTGDDTTPDTYNNHPDFISRNVGTGTVIDVTGDGLPAGTGGGGLGKVTITNWPGGGTVKTTQSITSFTLRNGDCDVAFEVDKNHTGANTVADVGRMVITHGAWGSIGTEIEGAVGSFSAQAFLAGATITAGNILKFTVKNGPFAGTVTLAKADDARVGSFTVNGDFTGTVDAAESIKNVNVKGDFRGSLSAQAIASITAYTFDGTAIGDTFGDPTRLNIIATAGSLGNLKAKAGLIKNFDISVATIFAGINVPKVSGLPPLETGVKSITVNAGAITSITSAYDISDSIFASATTIARVLVGAAALNADVVNTKILAGANLGTDLALGGVLTAADTFTAASITNFKIFGSMTTGSFVGAGANPVDGIFGNAGDHVIGGVTSSIPTLAVTGSVSADSHFTAGFFKKPKLANLVINPLTDARFTLG